MSYKAMTNSLSVNHCLAYCTFDIKKTNLAVKIKDSKSCTHIFLKKEIGKPFTNNIVFEK